MLIKTWATSFVSILFLHLDSKKLKMQGRNSRFVLKCDTTFDSFLRSLSYQYMAIYTLVAVWNSWKIMWILNHEKICLDYGFLFSRFLFWNTKMHNKFTTLYLREEKRYKRSAEALPLNQEELFFIISTFYKGRDSFFFSDAICFSYYDSNNQISWRLPPPSLFLLSFDCFIYIYIYAIPDLNSKGLCLSTALNDGNPLFLRTRGFFFWKFSLKIHHQVAALSVFLGLPSFWRHK